MIYINLLIIILLIIFIHELGHYCTARLFNTQVTDFSIGFGKSIYNFVDKHNTNWKISIIPLGGYVKIKGLDTIFQNKLSKTDEVGTFQSLSLLKKILILLAGSFFNILSVFLILFILIFFVGFKSYTNEIGGIIENSPAAENDIRKGDLILSINDNVINNFNDIIKNIGNKESVFLLIGRKNFLIKKNIKLEYDEERKQYILGITNSDNFITDKFHFINSFKNSFFSILDFYFQLFNSLEQSFKKNNIANDLAGPIGIVKNVDKFHLNDLSGILNMFIIFSLSISMLNLLPIPLLDGGHIVYFTIRSIFSNSLPEFITKMYLIVGFTIISFLFLIITFNDIFYK